MVNFNNLVFRISLIILLLFSTLEDCPANLQLPVFYKSTVSLSMLRGTRSTPNSNKYVFYYVLNYPSQLITKPSTTNINSIISIQKQQTNDFPLALNYRMKQIRSPTSLLISAQSTNFIWKTLQLSILLFLKQSYPSIIFGQLLFTNQQSKSLLTTTSKLSYNYKQNFGKSLTFINGINIVHTKQFDYQFQIKIIDSINYNTGQIVIDVNVGQSTRLIQLYISYIVYAIGQSQYQVLGMYVGLADVGMGAYNFYIGNQISTSAYLFAGISSFKFKKGSGIFAILLDYKQNSQNILQVSLASPFTMLNTAIFLIGNKQKNICKLCPNSNIIFNTYPKTICVKSCPSGVAVKNSATQTDQCLICSTQLNFGIVDGKCQCINGFKNVNGQCLPNQISVNNIQRTLSVRNSDCTDPNSFKNGEICVCKPGYVKQPANRNLCTSICSAGYFNGQTCINCPPGTYPWNQLQKCLQCGRDCINCRSQYICQQCKPGFYLSNKVQCTQICGDGLKIYDQCDDGNIQNGDGCSSQCKIQYGFNCYYPPGLRSICTMQNYQVIRKQSIFLSGNLLVQYQMQPPPTKIYTSSELQQIIKIKFLSSPPYQSYLVQNPSNLSLFRLVAAYGGNAPLAPAIIDVDFKLPNGNLFKQRITQKFMLDGGGRLFSRQQNNNNDTLN